MKKSRLRYVLRALLILAAAVVTLLVVAGFVLTRPFREPSWGPVSHNTVSIYRDGEFPVVSPFHLQTDPMEGLLLINFEEDPDSVYVGFEPQFFNDSIHGRGLLVIGWRRDGRVDIFHDEGLRLDPETYGITGSGLHVMVERSFSEDLFELGPHGVQAEIAFQDLEGRAIRLVVRETDRRPRTPFGLLAPMGVAATDPPALPLVYVDGFYFVRRAGTEYRIEIDGRSHEPDFIPLILDGTTVLFLRYSADPFIVTWNPDGDAMVRVLEPDTAGSGAPVADGLAGDVLPGETRAAYADGVRYELEENGGFHEIRRMSRREGDYEVIVEFNPAIPQLPALADSVEVSGAFRVTAGPGLGAVRGSWQVARRGSEVHLQVAPDGGWTPGPVPPMARALFRAVSMFREWPTTYVWRGTIQFEGPPEGPAEFAAEQPLPFRSGWERIPEP